MFALIAVCLYIRNEMFQKILSLNLLHTDASSGHLPRQHSNSSSAVAQCLLSLLCGVSMCLSSFPLEACVSSTIKNFQGLLFCHCALYEDTNLEMEE